MVQFPGVPPAKGPLPPCGPLTSARNLEYPSSSGYFSLAKKSMCSDHGQQGQMNAQHTTMKCSFSLAKNGRACYVPGFKGVAFLQAAPSSLDGGTIDRFSFMPVRLKNGSPGS